MSAKPWSSFGVPWISCLKVGVQSNPPVIEGETRSPEWTAKNGYAQLAYDRLRTEVTPRSGHLR